MKKRDGWEERRKGWRIRGGWGRAEMVGDEKRW